MFALFSHQPTTHRATLRGERGFTLVELLVVFVIIAVVSIVSIPLGAPLQRNRDFSSTTADVWGTLRRAQTFSAAGVRSSGFGVHVVTSTNGAAYTLFQGATYASRDATYDEVFTLPPTIMMAATISGNGPDIIFLQGSGKASTTATLTLTNDINQTASITVNADGMVNH